jgi:hypothetical protein
MAMLVSLPRSGLAQLDDGLLRLSGDIPGEDLMLPWQGSGAWRLRNQLVWDPNQKRLVRRNYEIWDPLAASTYDLYWISDDYARDRDGQIAGTGKLVWRIQGSATYDPSASVAEYRGGFRSGKADGEGTFFHMSGVSYRGAWKDGLMEGPGRLLLANGDEYVGFFHKGRREGAGVYIDTAGNIYDGSFLDGKREGQGRLTMASGLVFEALWKNDAELPGSRSVIKQADGRLRLITEQQIADVRLGISVDRRPVRGLTDVNPLYYASENSAEKLSIFPDSRRLLDVWRGQGELQLTSEEQGGRGVEISFLGTPNRYQPVPIIVGIQNQSNKPIRITGAFIDVASSVSNRDPAIQLPRYVGAWCESEGGNKNLTFENFGWSDVKNARVEGHFVAADGRSVSSEFSVAMPDFKYEGVADFSAALASQAFQFDNLQAIPFSCGGSSDSECLVIARSSGRFGRLAEAVTLDGSFFYLNMRASLIYDWTDQNGVDHHRESPFKIAMAAGSLGNLAECGEGGEEESYIRNPFDFRADDKSYRIPIPINDDVPAGVTARWRMKLDAPMSSTHDFTIVLVLADGRKIVSKPVSFMYFKPIDYPRQLAEP